MSGEGRADGKLLAGVRVLELARVLAGPWAGQLLADLGADVVKVERPGTGDDTRAWGPPFVTASDGTPISSGYFQSTNRGKRSVALDLETVDGQNAVRRLAARADVVIENFKVGGLAKYGLDFTSLSNLNSKLIYCSVTGFGQDGPYAHRAGYDFLIQGMSGVMSLTGDPDGEPMKAGVAFADIFTGLYASNAILAALFARDRTGRGCHIDMALLDTQLAVLSNQAQHFLLTGVAPPRVGNAHTAIVPYQVFPVRDGYVIIACGNDGQFRRLCLALGTTWHEDADYATNPARVANREILVPMVRAATAKRIKADLLAVLEAATVPAGPINALAEVFADPQVVARGMVRDLPTSGESTVSTLRTPIVIDGCAQVAEHAAPALGEHGAEILSEDFWPLRAGS